MAYSFLPGIRRARDFHLYAKNGFRYLDMYLGGGRALLGHRPAGLSRVLKNELQKGLLAEFPSVYSARLEKALLRFAALSCAGAACPGAQWGVRVYASFDRALEAVGKFFGSFFREEDIGEPFFAPAGDFPVYFRPFTETDYSGFPLLVPVLPFCGSFGPQPLFFRQEGGDEKRAACLPESDALSPVLAAGLCRLVEELSTMQPLAEQKGADLWAGWKLKDFRRFGCYCFPVSGSSAAGNYEALFRRFLAGGVLVSPAAGRPTILPRVFSRGEKSLVQRLASGGEGRP